MRRIENSKKFPALFGNKHIQSQLENPRLNMSLHESSRFKAATLMTLNNLKFLVCLLIPCQLFQGPFCQIHPEFYGEHPMAAVPSYPRGGG